MVNYFSSKSKCSSMLKLWWYKQVLINFIVHGYILLCSFFNSPCFQYIIRIKGLTFWEFLSEFFFFDKKWWKIWFLTLKLGVNLYTGKYGKWPAVWNFSENLTNQGILYNLNYHMMIRNCKVILRGFLNLMSNTWLKLS